MHTPAFHLPNTVLIDEIVPVELTHAAPYQHITIRAQMTDRFGQCWESHARFLTDAEGTISSATHAPLAGTYGECDPTGLFWSMQPQKKTDADPTKDPLSPLVVQFTAETDAGETLASSTGTSQHLETKWNVSRKPYLSSESTGRSVLTVGQIPYGATTLLLGGTPQATAQAQTAGWKQVFSFLRRHA